MGLKSQTKRHQNNTPICFAHLDKCNGIVLACWRSTLPVYGARKSTPRPRGWCGARLGGTDCNVFRYSPPSRPLGSLTPTQPERVTNPTQGHPGSPWGAPQVECWSLRREPQPPAQHGSCAAERCRSRARPGQRLPPCMHSGGTARHLLVTSPKRARAV